MMISQQVFKTIGTRSRNTGMKERIVELLVRSLAVSLRLFRYKKSGVKHCYYLVEGDVRNSKHLSVSQGSIESAVLATQLLEGFKV